MIIPGITPNKNPAAILNKETEICVHNNPLVINSKNVETMADGGGKNRISSTPVREQISQSNKMKIGEIMVSNCFPRSFICRFFHSCCSVS